MRTIKFRGKLCHSNQWVYGNLIIANNGEPYIIPQEVFELDGHHLRIESDNPFRVKPETVGQFTVNQDKNNVDIYEGDIIRLNDFISYTGIKNAWVSERKQVIKNYKIGENISFIDFIPFCSIVGNIHDNPELLTKN